ncbi:MAG: tetratricopeptide repeat protein [Bacteroidales bacterium]
MIRFKWLKVAASGLLLSACVTTSHINIADGDNRISADERRKFDYFFQESLRKKGQGEYDAAFDLMKKAVSIDTASAPGRYDLANYYLQLGRPLVALDYLQGATRVDPHNYWYGMLEAHLLQNLNMSEKAIDAYKRLAAIYPDRPEINYSMADVYTQLGETRNAIEALDKLEENIGILEPVILEKHRLYLSLKETDSAFNEVKKLIETYPGQIQYPILLGDLYLGEGMLKQADSAYQEAAKIDPENAYLLVSKADYLNQIGNIKASNELVQDALVNEKLDVDTKIKILTGYLTTVLQKKDSVALAQSDSLFTIVLDQHPQVSELHGLYAELLLTTDRLAQAREQLGYAVDFNPNDRKLWLQLIGVGMKQENYKDIVEVTNRGMKYLPEMPELYLYQGVAYSLLEKPDSALAAYRLGLTRIDPKNVQMISDIWGQIGDVYHRLGQQQQAYDAYEEALKYNEKNIGVLNNYSYYLSLDKSDLSKAERMAAQVVKLEPNNPTYLDTYAWIFFQQGNYMLAKFYINSAISKEKTPSSDILEHYGDILYMDGDPEAALIQWKKALEAAKTQVPPRDKKELARLKRKIETKKYIAE